MNQIYMCEMEHFISKILPIFLAALVGFCAGLATAEPSAMELRSQFERDAKLLDAPLAGLNSKYREYLENEKTAFQQAGNLKGMLAVDEELNGFESGSTQPNSKFSEIKRLQEIYQKQKAELGRKRQEQYLNLIGGYRKKAEDMATESTKAGQIEEAKLALAESEKFAAMQKEAANQSPVAPQIPGAAVAPAPAGTGPNWATLLEEAKTSIRKIEDMKIQNRLWRDYARGLANCGNSKEGELSAKRIDDDEVKSLALVDVALALAKAGQFDDAISAIRAVSNKWQADFGLAKIAAIQIERNNMSGAAKTADLIRGPAGKSIYCVDQAIALQAKGDTAGFKTKIEQAKSLAITLADETEMKEAFRKIAVAQVNAGDVDGAKATANLFRGHRFGSPILYIIEALAKKGDFRGAHGLRGSSGFTMFTGSITGGMISEAEANAGKFQDAKNTAKGISYTDLRMMAFTKISVIEQDLDTARASAEAVYKALEGNREERYGRSLALTGVLQAKKEGMSAAATWARALKEPTVRSLALIALAESAVPINQ